MSQQVIAPAAVNALKEALTLIYWYKSELRSFLSQVISDPRLLARLNWEEYKRNIVTSLVDFMATHQDVYQADLLRLMVETSKITDFSHLSHLDDGASKAKRASDAVGALNSFVGAHASAIEDQASIEERRRLAYERQLRNQGVRERLDVLCQNYYGLLSEDSQKRGFSLEKLLRDLFELFDLDPKASFRITGEQIDGAFTFEGIDFLLEAKWRNESTGAADMDAFGGKLSRKLENTLGLFLSINGFSEDGIHAVSGGGRRLMLLMDGSDLMAVLEGRIDLIQLLLRKRRHAAQTGNVYLPIHELLRS